MGYRLSRITTRTGDKGTTGLANGLRVEKDSPRVLTMGAVDELNSCIGVVLAHGTPSEIRDCLVEVQQRLFEVGAQLSSPGQQRIVEEDVLTIERAVERFNAQLEPLKEFVLPGGSLAAAACHVARTVCRRAESHVVALSTADPGENDALIPFLNRLSDLLFVVARVLNKADKSPESMWRGPRR
jgi:cob(I)alamin adenosyltransferase